MRWTFQKWRMTWFSNLWFPSDSWPVLKSIDNITATLVRTRELPQTIPVAMPLKHWHWGSCRGSPNNLVWPSARGQTDLMWLLKTVVRFRQGTQKVNSFCVQKFCVKCGWTWLRKTAQFTLVNLVRRRADGRDVGSSCRIDSDFAVRGPSSSSRCMHDWVPPCSAALRSHWLRQLLLTHVDHLTILAGRERRLSCPFCSRPSWSAETCFICSQLDTAAAGKT